MNTNIQQIKGYKIKIIRFLVIKCHREAMTNWEKPTKNVFKTIRILMLYFWIFKYSKLNHLKTTLFKFNADNPFNGIISHLKAQFGVNIDQTLEITASSVFTSRLIPSNVINYDENSKHFCSGDIENSWISFDFKYNRIIPTSYAIRPKQRKVTPLNWIIEGSNDNRTWKTIDEQKDALVLRDFSPHNFEINNKEGFKFIRMQMKGKNIGGNTYTLIIHSFEFYGTLISTF